MWYPLNIKVWRLCFNSWQCLHFQSDSWVRPCLACVPLLPSSGDKSRSKESDSHSSRSRAKAGEGSTASKGRRERSKERKPSSEAISSSASPSGSSSAGKKDEKGNMTCAHVISLYCMQSALIKRCRDKFVHSYNGDLISGTEAVFVSGFCFRMCALLQWRRVPQY